VALDLQVAQLDRHFQVHLWLQVVEHLLELLELQELGLQEQRLLLGIATLEISSR
jgi:hypothetical protein